MAESLVPKDAEGGVRPRTIAPEDTHVAQPGVAERKGGRASTISSDIRLSEAQSALLRRIADGRTPVTSHQHWWGVDVHALRSRGLVRTRRSRERSTAEITEAGRSYVEQMASQVGMMDADGDAQARSRLSATDVLRQVDAAGGVLVIADPDAEKRVWWRRSLDVLVRDGLPGGRRLVYSGRRSGDLVITVAAGSFADPTAVGRGRQRAARAPAVPVHPLMRPLQRMTAVTGAPGEQGEPSAALGIRVPRVSQAMLPRALRLFSKLLNHAEQRGHEVALSRGPAGGQGRDICIVVDGQEYPVRIGECRGVLSMRLPGHCSGRRWWVDGTRAPIEDKVSDVLEALEKRAEAAAQRRAERQRLAEQEQQALRELQRRAREAYLQDRGAQLLREQVRGWRLAADIRALCAAVRCRVARGSAEAWLAWAEFHADRLDPLSHPLVVPDIPEPESEDLARYINQPV